MNIDKDKALEIAKDFALSEYKDTDWSLNIDDTRIKLCKGGFGTDILGLSDQHWSVIISTNTNDPGVATMDPDHVIVLVDSGTGSAKWFPIM